MISVVITNHGRVTWTHLGYAPHDNDRRSWMDPHVMWVEEQTLLACSGPTVVAAAQGLVWAMPW
jgi:hypothetical protein